MTTLFSPQLTHREPQEALGTLMDVGTEWFLYIRAHGAIRAHMPVAISPPGIACETDTLAPQMGVAGYAIPDAMYGWVMIQGTSRVNPEAKRRLDAEAARRAGSQ